MGQSTLYHQVFSEDEQIQREQLKENPLMKQYKQFREECRGDLLHPTYHFFSPDGRINDPNGLCYWNGKYHIFYQQYPPEYPRQHWGHAISDDMVHWEDLPSAIYPDIEDACFSGNTLVEEGRVIAMYHGWQIGNMIATSSDPLLLNWEKNPANPVIPHLPDLPPSGFPYRVFDPFIWKEDEGYYALSGTHHNAIMYEHVFFSQDLTRWTYIGKLMDSNPHVECPNDGACPYFLPFGENEKILFFFSHSSGSRCLIGTYDKITHKFTPKRSMIFSRESVGVSSLVAPCAMSDGNGGVYVIYNLGDSIVNGKRRGMFSLMRHMMPGEDNSVIIKPIESAVSLRLELLCDEKITLDANKRTKIQGGGKCIEIETQIDMKDARAIELRVLADKESKEYTTVTITKGMNRITTCGYVSIDNTHSSLLPEVIGRIPDSTRFLYDGNEKLNVRIFIDNCIVEVFVNDRVALSQLAYSSLPQAEDIYIEAIGGEAKLENIKIWKLDGIYGGDKI